MVILKSNPGVLFFGPAMRHCEVVRVTAGSDVENLQMAQLTWPMQVMRHRPGETDRPLTTVMQAVRMGKEHDLVTLIGDEHERNSVRINVALRAMYSLLRRSARRPGNGETDRQAVFCPSGGGPGNPWVSGRRKVDTRHQPRASAIISR